MATEPTTRADRAAVVPATALCGGSNRPVLFAPDKSAARPWRPRALFPRAGWIPLVLSATGFVLVYATLATQLSIGFASLFWVALAAVIFCMHRLLFAVALLIVAMLLSPEIRLDGDIVLRAGDLIIPAICIGLVARATRAGTLVWRKALPGHSLPALLAVLALSSVLGVMGGRVEWTTAVLWNLKMAQLMMIYGLTLNLLSSSRQAYGLLVIGALVYVAVSGYAMAAIPQTELHTLRRVSAPFEVSPEPTTLGGYLTLVSTMLMAIALYEPSGRRRVLWWSLAIVCVAPLLYTFSRTSYLAYAAALLCLGLLAKRPWIVMAVALLLAVMFFWGPEFVVARVASTFDDSRVHGFDPSVWERITVWSKVWHNLGIHPFFGMGFPQPILDSQFARILIESGIAGLLAWIGVLVGCGRLGFRFFRRTTNPLNKGIALGYIVALAGLIAHSSAAITFYIVRIMEPFWLLTGIVAFLDYDERRQARRNSELGTLNSEP